MTTQYGGNTYDPLQTTTEQPQGGLQAAIFSDDPRSEDAIRNIIGSGSDDLVTKLVNVKQVNRVRNQTISSLPKPLQPRKDTHKDFTNGGHLVGATEAEDEALSFQVQGLRMVPDITFGAC